MYTTWVNWAIGTVSIVRSMPMSLSCAWICSTAGTAGAGTVNGAFTPPPRPASARSSFALAGS